MSMYSNYFKSAWRNLSSNPRYTILNIFGLAIGIGVGLLVLLWVQYQYSQYGFAEAARIYRVNAHFKSGEGVNSWPYTSAAIAPHALREIPELEQAVRISDRPNEMDFHINGKVLFEKNAAYVDSAFFEFFGLEMVAGDPKHPFTAVNSIVMTETMAHKFFGDENPIGKIMQRGPDPKDMFVVSGVMRDWPSYAGFNYTHVLNFERNNVNFKDPSNPSAKYEDTWGSYSMFTFLKVRPDATLAAVEKKVDDMNDRNEPDPINKGKTQLSLQPIQQIALYDAAGHDTGAQTARIFLFAAIFILGIACINYINLSTAQATKRAREVGMRKIIGAEKGQLLGQFLLESALVTGTAFLLGLVLLRLALPYCNDFLEQRMVLDLRQPEILGLLGGTFVGILLLSGLYPAVVLARFQPMQVLKGAVKSNSAATQLLRRSLVVLQFSLSIILLVGTMLIGRQLDFLRQRDAGLSRDHVFSFSLRPAMMEHKAAMLAELEQTPGVESVAQAGFPILGSIATTSGDWDGKPSDTNIDFYYFNVDKNLKDALKVQLLEGEWFTGTAADSNKFVVNETAIRIMGMKDPIGKRLSIGGDGVIVGVVKDFNFSSAKEKIRPAALFSHPNDCSLVYVKAQAQAVPGAVASAGDTWRKYESTMPFDYQFLDDEFDKMYRSEQRTGVLFNIFAAIALLIACIGLFGLASFMAAQRNKEIGIRKVLGATVLGISNLLVRDFLQLVLLSVVIASPIAWWAMNKWLADFAYRIDIQWWMFVVAGLAAIAIALVTVSFQSIRAALANPVKSLRSE